MKNNKQLKELFDTFSKDFKELLNEDEQPTLEKGRWYKQLEGKAKVYTTSELDENNWYKCCGFNIYGKWFSRGQTQLEDEVLMTNSEIIEMAKNYLENTLGFTKGCKFKSAATGMDFNYKSINISDEGGIYTGEVGGYLFNPETGKWATLIKDEPLLWLDGSEIRLEGEECVWINNVWFNKEEIQALSAHPIFQKILDRMGK